MRIKKMLFTKNICAKSQHVMNPIGIMVHSTGANNPNVRRYIPGDAETGLNQGGNHWDQTNEEWKKKFDEPLNVCVHAFLGYFADGKTGIVHVLPYDKMAFHCGGLANTNYISFEICEDALNNESYFYNVMSLAQEYCAYLMKHVIKTNNVNCVMSHHEGYIHGIASNHADIDHWLKIYGKNMDWFRDCVAKLLEGGEEVTQEQFNKMMDEYLKQLYSRPAPDWAKDAVEWAKENSISDGSGPDAIPTRAQVWLMIKNAMRA